MIDPPIHPSHNATVETPRKRTTAAEDLMQWFLDQNEGQARKALHHACITLIALGAHLPKGMLRLPPNHIVKPPKKQAGADLEKS